MKTDTCEIVELMSKYLSKAPVKLTEEQLLTAFELALKGKTLKDISDALCITHLDLHIYLTHNREVCERLQDARQDGLETIADELLTIADEYVDVQRARLKSDNVKWLLSKRKPAVYGDKIDVNVNQTIDIGTALQEARKRALPSTDDTKRNDINILPVQPSVSKDE